MFLPVVQFKRKHVFCGWLFIVGSHEIGHGLFFIDTQEAGVGPDKTFVEDTAWQEIEIFCQLFTQPAVEAGLRKFVESTDAQPYLP